MKLCIRSLALASGILWGGMFLVVGLMNQLGGDYGAHLMAHESARRGLRRSSHGLRVIDIPGLWRSVGVRIGACGHTVWSC